MKLRTIEDVHAFETVLDSCTGDVYMCDSMGSRFNLRSKLSQYILMAELLKNPDNDLELFATKKEDEYKLLAFLNELQEKEIA